MTSTLGVVLLDCDHYREPQGSCEPGTTGPGVLPAGFFESPASWPFPTRYAIARGAHPTAALRGEAPALEGLSEAIGRIADGCDLVITDCGFFYAGREAAQAVTDVPVLSSGLELVALAAAMTAAPIGMLTISAERVRMLLDHQPDAHRLRIVEVEGLPSWAALGRVDFASNPAWTTASLERELVALVERQRRDGDLRDAGILVLECTVMPQFRRALQSVTGLPVLDAMAIAQAALE